MARKCVFCGRTPVTSEHVFKRGFRKKLQLPEVERRFRQRKGTPSHPTTTRPDPMFELKVRRVCKRCNGGWMDRLDHSVEPWVLDPGREDLKCDPTLFRRWAIKTAIMRSLVDNPNLLPPADFKALITGDDIEGWHVFIGRSDFREWRHACVSFGGGGGDKIEDGMTHGVVHVSWVLGEAVVSTVRCVGDDGGAAHFLKAFRDYNHMKGDPLVEMPYGQHPFPSVAGRRKLMFGQAEPFFLFFTSEPVSPVASFMQAGYAALEKHEQGKPNPA